MIELTSVEYYHIWSVPLLRAEDVCVCLDIRLSVGNVKVSIYIHYRYFVSIHGHLHRYLISDYGFAYTH